MKKLTLAKTQVVIPTIIVIDETGEHIAPLLLSRFLMPILFLHQAAMEFYYAVMEARRLAPAILAGLWRDATRPLTEAVAIVMAGIIIKSVWLGVTT